jgi:leucyl aminopeptidase
MIGGRMEIQFIQKNIGDVSADVLAVNLFEDQAEAGRATAAINDKTNGFIARHLAEQSFTGKDDEMLVLHTPFGMQAKHIIVLGLGKSEEYTLVKVRQAAARLVKKSIELKAKSLTTIVHGMGANNLDTIHCAQVFAEGLQLGAYRFDRYKTQQKETVQLETVCIVESEAPKFKLLVEGVKIGDAIATAVLNARDIVNEPPSKIKPSSMVTAAAEIASLSNNITVNVFDEDQLKKEGYNTILAVAAGSEEKPYLIHLHYQPAQPKARIAFVGKGVTFDSGGLGLKPWNALLTMKTDMAGAAAVLGIFQALAELEAIGYPIDIEVEGIIPTTENMISGKAMKPDDIIVTKNGKTVEILHTDAEGRLILADALSYATTLDPYAIVDFATLTGSAIQALGTSYSAMMSNDEALAEQLTQASQMTGEQLWRLPLVKEYHSYIESDVADLQNISTDKEGPDAIIGGLFLQEFVDETPWAHIDMAGPSFQKSDKNAVYPKGATGYGVLLALQLLRSW